MSAPHQPPVIPFNNNLRDLMSLHEARDHFPIGQPESEAALMSELARLGFVDDMDYIRKTLRGIGFDAVRRVEAKGARALICECEGQTLIAFPGTDIRQVRDWGRDINALPRRWRAGGRVHSGFASGLEALWPQVAAGINKRRKPVVFGGHSLGGTYATLAHSLRPDAMAYSFGAPVVGDEAFGKLVNPQRLHRYVHCADSATLYVKTRLTPYEHWGKLHYITAAGKIIANPDAQEMLADQEAAKRAYSQTRRIWFTHTRTRGLADHHPLNYSSALMGLRPATPDIAVMPGAQSADPTPRTPSSR